MSGSAFPFVSVLMPVRNEGAFIGRSLALVLAQDYPGERMEVVVADGMSTDETRAVVREVQKQHSNVRMVDNPIGIVSTGLNAALRVARGDVIVRVDGHCEVAPDYVSRCVNHLLTRDIDGVGGPVRTIGLTPNAQAIALGMSSRFGVGDSAFRTGVQQPTIVDSIPFPAYWRRVIESAGLYDEELVRDQDDEYNYRLRKFGARLLLAPDVRSDYFSRATLRALWRQYFQYGFWKVRVLQKHPRQMQPRQFVPGLFVGSLGAGIVLAPFTRIARWLTALLALIYLLANTTASFNTARRNGWVRLPRLPLVFGVLHFAYGSGFLWGVVKHWKRWPEVF